MKLLIKKIANIKIIILLRNFIGFRPVIFSPSYKKFKTVSVSDAFAWRTDNGYKTIFKYTDILGLFSKLEGSFVELIFFTKDNEFIKKIVINQLDYSNELLIDKEFLNGKEGYGTFSIFHHSKIRLKDELAIANRCYVGFSINNGSSSFVHGNGHVNFKSLNGEFHGSGMVLKSLFKNTYRIQNSFLGFEKTELFFVNPSSKRVKFSIGSAKYNLKQGCSILVDVSAHNNVSIKSRCLFLRPTVFNYHNNFFDVYHS